MSTPSFADYEDAISEMPFLQELKPDVREHVLTHFEEVSTGRSVESGDVLYKEGEHGSNTGVILASGVAEVSNEEGDAPLRIKAPTLFGEMMQLNERHLRTATVTVTEGGCVFDFTWHDLVSKAIVSLDDEQQLQLRNAIEDLAGRRFKTLEEIGGS